MRRFLIIIIQQLLLFTIAENCFAHSWPFVEKDSIMVSGTIIGFRPNSDESFISFQTHDLQGLTTKHSFEISPNGHFIGKLFQPYEGDIFLLFKERCTILYVKPGNHLFLTIRNDKANGTSDLKEVISVKGESGAINKELFNFFKQYERHQFFNKTDIANNDQTDSAFAAARIKRLTEELNFLALFGQQSGKRSRTFEKWAKNYLVYDAAYEIILFPFLGKLNKNINYRELFSMLKNIPPNNESALQNSYYYRFLNQLTGSLDIIRNINPVYNSIKKYNGYDRIAFILDKIDENFTGIAREIMYLDYYDNTKDEILNESDSSVNKKRERFYRNISDPYIKKLFLEREESSAKTLIKYNVRQRLKEIHADSVLKERLLLLLGKKKDSSLFIDFWGSWCGPCMLEMPYYHKFITSFAGKPLKFLFFSVNTPENTMNDVKQRYGIEGEFINLSRDESDIMNMVFEFNSYPRHFIIDSNGLLVDKTISNFVSGGKINSGVIERIKKNIAN